MKIARRNSLWIIENLLRAYMLEGKEIFEEDDKKYFEFLKANVGLDIK